MYHLQLILLRIPLLKPLDKYTPPFLLLLFSLLLIKRIASQAQIAHDLIIQVEQIEHCKGEHKNGENDHNLRPYCHLSEEIKERCAWHSRNLQVVVAEGITHPC